MSTSVYLDNETGAVFVDFGDGVYTKVTAEGENETDVTTLPDDVTELVDAEEAYEEGHSAGYDDGYSDGCDQGYSEYDLEAEYDRGYEEGLAEGNTAGYEEGRNSVLEEKDPED